MSISRVSAIKGFMGESKPVEFSELKELLKKDKEGYEWMAQECAKALGEELEEKKGV